MSAQPEEVLNLLKIVADESRLTLLRLLNQGEYSVGELAGHLNLGEPTVSHHLSRLRKVGLVTLRMDGNQRFYRIHESGLAHFKSLVTHLEDFPLQPESSVSDNRWIDRLGLSPEDSQVLYDHTHNGKLTHLPRKHKKLVVILIWLATLFQPDTLYTEGEVNEVIQAVYREDYVGLRRDLVDMGYLRRERGGGKYWLTPGSDHPA